MGSCPGPPGRAVSRGGRAQDPLQTAHANSTCKGTYYKKKQAVNFSRWLTLRFDFVDPMIPFFQRPLIHAPCNPWVFGVGKGFSSVSDDGL